MCFVIAFLIYDIFCPTLATYCSCTFVRHLQCGDLFELVGWYVACAIGRLYAPVYKWAY